MQTPEAFLGETEKYDMRARYLQYFKSCRDEYKDDLPDKELKLDDPDYHLHKRRYNFWNGIAGRIENLIELEIISEPKKVQILIESLGFIRSQDRSKLRTREDIIEINKILDKLIEILS